ncbi:MAG: hypothetical protein H6828_15190 [Planctomycetes bacterium]|nr:hypothetical protein [Planctomycetota bacterium]
MLRSTLAAFALALPVAPTALQAPAPQSDAPPAAEPDRFSADAEAEQARRDAALEQELAGAELPAWAGRYYYGDGTGVNVSLALAPRAGFSFRWNGCTGLYDRNYGPLRDEAGVLHLAPTFPNDRKGFRGTATELRPVRWGARRYLVEESRLGEFVNEVNGGQEPRKGAWGSTLLGHDDWKLAAEGAPELPKTWRARLLAEPLTVAIDAVVQQPDPNPDDSWQGRVDLELGAGAEAGLWVGMRLYAEGGDRAYVTEVSAGSARAEITTLWKDDAAPSAGQSLRSRR